MNNTLQCLEYHPTVEVRMMIQDGEPWWVLADVCRALGLSNPSKVAARLDEDERQQLQFSPNSELGLNHNTTTIISESGLYSVILRSDKPEAKAFKRWVTHEVLPSIRRTGVYSTSGTGRTSTFVAITGAMATPYTAYAQLLLLKLLELDRMQEGTGTVQISNPEITRLLGVKSRHTMAAARKELIAAGAIEYTAGTRAGPGVYRLKST